MDNMDQEVFKMVQKDPSRIFLVNIWDKIVEVRFNRENPVFIKFKVKQTKPFQNLVRMNIKNNANGKKVAFWECWDKNLEYDKKKHDKLLAMRSTKKNKKGKL